MTQKQESLIYLSDRGINQAIGIGAISGVKSYAESDEAEEKPQIQPASINFPSERDQIVYAQQRRMLLHKSMGLAKGLVVSADFRSRLRRNGLRIESYSQTDNGVMMVNPTTQQYELREGEHFCHGFIGGAPQLDMGKGAALSDLDHGRVIEDTRRLERILGEHISFTNKTTPVIEDGFIVFHVGGFLKSIGINPTSRGIKSVTDIHDYAVSEKIPPSGYTARWNDGYNIALAEEISLSDQVELQLFSRSNSQSGLVKNGIVDAGYSGGLSWMPLIGESIRIHRGQPAVYARVLFFEKAVERSYDHASRESSFQRYLWDNEDSLARKRREKITS